MARERGFSKGGGREKGAIFSGGEVKSLLGRDGKKV